VRGRPNQYIEILSINLLGMFQELHHIFAAKSRVFVAPKPPFYRVSLGKIISTMSWFFQPTSHHQPSGRPSSGRLFRWDPQTASLQRRRRCIRRTFRDFFQFSGRIFHVPRGTMGRTVYLPIHEWFIFMVNVGKYTVRPMDAMGV